MSSTTYPASTGSSIHIQRHARCTPGTRKARPSTATMPSPKARSVVYANTDSASITPLHTNQRVESRSTARARNHSATISSATPEITSKPSRLSCTSHGVAPAVARVSMVTKRERVICQASIAAAAQVSSPNSAAGRRTTYGVSGSTQVNGASA